MQFNSFAFAVFLVLVFAAYWALGGRRRRAQNVLLLVASYVFYGWWDWRFLGLIALSSAVDYFVGLGLAREERPRARRRLLGISLVVNLGMLGVFKYFDFFATSFASLLGGFGLQAHPFTLDVVLPVGISFYTFQTLSYTIDVYRRRFEPTKDALAFFAFVSFFPQLVAGPIERAVHLLPQFGRDRAFSYDQAVSGLRLMVWGFFKKIVVADRLAPFVELVYAQPDAPDAARGAVVVVGVLAFVVQVYADFSGYADIAIGCARLFGFDLSANFRVPLFAPSLRAFWSRWHITLYSWFRDYLYIPMGGSRVSERRWYFNILVVFTVSGLWHGAAWTFVAWGLLTGMGLVVEAFFRRHLPGLRLPAVLGIPATVGWFAFGMLFFRSADFGDAGRLLANAFLPGDPSLLHFAREAWGSLEAAGHVLLSVVLLFVFDAAIGARDDVNRIFRPLPGWLRWGLGYALVLWILLFGRFGTAPQFIYFQF